MWIYERKKVMGMRVRMKVEREDARNEEHDGEREGKQGRGDLKKVGIEKRPKDFCSWDEGKFWTWERDGMRIPKILGNQIQTSENLKRKKARTNKNK
jgi:hypothetical protein